MNLCLKKILFLCLRMRSDIVCFEGRQSSSGLNLKVCFVGNEKRGDYFIRHLFGHKPRPAKNRPLPFLAKTGENRIICFHM